jgi:hypothetical protein
MPQLVNADQGGEGVSRKNGDISSRPAVDTAVDHGKRDMRLRYQHIPNLFRGPLIHDQKALLVCSAAEAGVEISTYIDRRIPFLALGGQISAAISGCDF